MLAAHEILAFMVVGVPALAALVGGLVYWRRRGAGRLLANLLALAQTLLVAQVGLGLLLLSDDRKRRRRAPLRLRLALARRDPRALDVRAGSGTETAALVRGHFLARGGARRASIHDGTSMRRFFSEHTAIRGFLIIGLIALVVVVLSLEPVLATVGGLLRIAFFLAIAFFLFLMWREKARATSRPGTTGAGTSSTRRSSSLWSTSAPSSVSARSGPDALAFFLVLGACAYAVVRIWREEHRYS